MKKILNIILSLLIVISLTACDNKTNNNEINETNETNETNATVITKSINGTYILYSYYGAKGKYTHDQFVKRMSFDLILTMNDGKAELKMEYTDSNKEEIEKLKYDDKKLSLVENEKDIYSYTFDNMDTILLLAHDSEEKEHYYTFKRK